MLAIRVASVVMGGPRIRLNNQTVSGVAVDPTDAFARYHVDTDGDIKESTDGNPASTVLEKWLFKGAASGYEVRATLDAGGPIDTGDAVGTWLAVSSDRFWEITQASIGTKTADLTIEIRIAGGTILDSATVNLSAQVTA